MDATTLLNYFEEKRDSTIDLIKELVEIESPSFDVNGSRVATGWIAEKLGDLSFYEKIEKIEAKDIGEHLLAEMEGTGSQKPVLLLGHSDTVHPIGSILAKPDAG